MLDFKEIVTPFSEVATQEYWQQKAERYFKLLNVGSKEPRFFVIVNLNEPLIEHCSPGVYDLLGFGPKYLTLSNIFRLIHPDDIARYTLDEFTIGNFLKQLPADERSRYKISKRLRIRHASGRFVPISQQMVVMNEAGNINKLRAFAHVCLAPEQLENWSLRITPIQDYHQESSEPQKYVHLGDESNPLTNREMEILRLLVTNMSTKEIAEKICRSPHTVKNHRKNMLRKSGTSTTLELILLAKRKLWL